MTAAERAKRTVTADELCLSAYKSCAGPDVGAALIAVGGYGRGELAPYSDLDVVLVHDDGFGGANGLGDLAEKLWYPMWDAGQKLDYSVRSVSEMATAAGADLRVALGLLDIRHIAGDPNLTLRLRTMMLAHWRRDARAQLPQLRALVRQRHEVVGELAHASIPDIKEAEGGLRDAVVLKALVATWLVDVPHADLERSRLELLDVRDVVHTLAGRATDRIGPEVWGDLAVAMGYGDALGAQFRVRELGRRLTHLSRLAWRRARSVVERPGSASRPRRPSLESIAPGIAISSDEIVLDARAKPAEDPLLLLRAAAEAAERDIVLAPATAARLVREGAPVPEPWPIEARDLMVRLLAAGRGLLSVWETLEETGALDRILPEWERIRLLPHASAIHRYTVDRHVVETCIEAAAMIRHSSRPDVLVMAVLLHDIGKGGTGSHSIEGEPIARTVAQRMGFDETSVETIATLVRWHLLLSETAATRDPDDPATVGLVTAHIGSVETVSLLRTLTEADGRAASPQAWTTWRAGLVDRLTRRVIRAIDEPHLVQSARVDQPVEIPRELRRGKGNLFFQVDPVGEGARVTVIAPDRVGLLADVAAVLAFQRCSVRAARVRSQDSWNISEWDVADAHLEAAVLRQRFEHIVSGGLNLDRLRRGDPSKIAPAVLVRPEASDAATVLEVRATDRQGLLYLVCEALAKLNLSVRSAHVATVGPQAVDVFYVQESGQGALSDERAAAAAVAVRDALQPPQPDAP